jgi:hypothetical protein
MCLINFRDSVRAGGLGCHRQFNPVGAQGLLTKILRLHADEGAPPAAPGPQPAGDRGPFHRPGCQCRNMATYPSAMLPPHATQHFVNSARRRGDTESRSQWTQQCKAQAGRGSKPPRVRPHPARELSYGARKSQSSW